MTGKIIAIHESDFSVHGYIHHATLDAPQYAIRSDKTAHIAYHKGSALRLLEPGGCQPT
ncbi:DUF2945 domain-containing protein [Acidithiobacillus sp. YTS05]|nr:DUF2945 domain-containing protein [Acidithiobacillus sp. YTS05]